MGLNAIRIGLRIQEARLTKGFTQAELADALGIARGTVVRWENGQAVPSRVGLPKVARVLDKEPKWLLEGASEVTPADQHVEVLRAERRTLQEIRKEVRGLGQKLAKKNTRTVVAGVSQTTLPSVDQKTLNDIIRTWQSAKPEARMLAALLVTGDWSYKLKLWNREITVDEDVLAVLRHVP